MAAESRLRAVGQFPARVGLLFVAPGRSLAAIDRQGKGGVRDALVVFVLAILAFRLADLVRAVYSVKAISPAVALAQLFAVVGQELRAALIVALGASLVVTALAGRSRRDPGLDVELGAACTIPYVLLNGLSLWLPSDGFPWIVPKVVAAACALGAPAWALLVLICAVRVARRRPARTADTASSDPVAVSPPELPAAPSGRAKAAAAVLSAFLVGVMAINVRWMVRHPESISPVGPGAPAPTFSLPRIDRDSGDVALADLRGKVVLLDFWARWCPPCLAMMPTLHELYEKWKTQGVEILGINAEGSQTDWEGVREFVELHPAPYPNLADKQEVGGLYRVMSLPHLVLVGRDGVIRNVFVGQVPAAHIEAALRAATESSP